MSHFSILRFYHVSVFFLLLGLLSLPTIIGATPTKNQMIKDIVFRDINNTTHDLAEYRGKWLFINFWAGYCRICNKEIPTLIRFQQHNKNKVTLLGINYGAETRQEIMASIRRYHFNYSIVPDQASISRYFNDIPGTPTTIIVSPQGRIIAKAVGRESYQELESYLDTQQHTDKEEIWDFSQSNN